MTIHHCCERLREAVEFRCDQHPGVGECGDYLVGYSEKFDEYGLWVHDGPGGSASSWIEIHHCPFCGGRMSPSRREEWFDRLEVLGVDPEDAPPDMQSSEWWLGEGETARRPEETLRREAAGFAVSDDIDRVAAEWLRSRAMAEIASDGFAQVDIDELFDDLPIYPVPVGLQLLRAAVRDARQVHPGLTPMLVVPLPAAEGLVVGAPDFAEVVAVPWEDGPGLEVVGLYLLEPRVLAADEPAEEYRCHVDAHAVLGAGPSVYFRSWRTLAEAANGWEFNQAFYIRA